MDGYDVLIACEWCRSEYDTTLNAWWPADCARCEGATGWCEHDCNWLLLEGIANGEDR